MNSTTNLNADVRATNTLQVADSLLLGGWDDVSSVAGVAATNWVVIETTNSAFYQIESSY